MNLNRHTLTVVRKLNGLSKAQLAERAGIDASLVTRIENGQRTASPAVILKLADALRVPPISLADDPDEAA